ncbi:hypothetical protein CWB41_01470 [Methylovirgula ligni]|uniref:Outer membrane autotransporter protein n=1 Tax=Methylovirgula ligni TaxID=569860 RepID=A0A3D9Z0C7_9HYPH|nr:autotransporter outer membrane beta-barrel domain-containing protein [Methylovirgula ligni]QAY94575.1 hypothetical protein CWB41_01470 [Methylovirgula ligni]REF87558.1 outer membrane autotransporter protein [Methylovirgula ligni]
MQGGNDFGALATHGGTITLSDAAVSMYSVGGNNIGLSADSTGGASAITANNVVVSMEDANNPSHVDNEIGAQATNGANITLNSGSVSVYSLGSGEKGLVASGVGSKISANGVLVDVRNGTGAGVEASSGATIALTQDSAIYTGGAGTPGGHLLNGGTITMDGGSVSTAGAGSDGFYVEGNAGILNTAQLNDVTVSATGASFDVNNATADIALTGTTATVNNGIVLDTRGAAGLTIFDAGSSILQGTMITAAGSTSDVTLHDQTTWVMTGNSNVTDLTNDTSTIIYSQPTGDPTQQASFKTLTANNYVGANGLIELNTYLGTDGAPSDLLVIDGGTATGSTALQIANAGGPGEQTYDNGILVVSAINGAATASDAFYLSGGELRAGAFDYDLFQGGLGGSDPESWYLRSSFVVPQPGEPPPTPPVEPPPVTPGQPEPPPVVVPPPITPEQPEPPPIPPPEPPPTPPGPPTPPPVEPPPPPTPPPPPPVTPTPPIQPITPPIEPGPPIPVTPTFPPTDVLPPDPPPSTLPPGTYPIIGPEIATYGVVQPVARQLGLLTLGTLHDRIGDTLLDDIGSCTPDRARAARNAASPLSQWALDCTGNGWRPPVWARVFGERIEDHYLAYADPRTSGQILGMQAGVDLWRGALAPGHRDAAGLYFSYADANVDVDGLVTNATATNYVLEHTGRVDLSGLSAGAYWTHYGPGGWYIDSVIQATRYDGEATTQYASLPTQGYGVIGSLEAGYPFAIPMLGPGFALEPQGQIIGQHVEFDDASDESGEVALGTTNGVTGRLGLRGRWSFETVQGQIWQPYLRVNFWRDWGGNVLTTYATVDQVPLEEQDERVEAGGGLTVKINEDFGVFANGDYEFGVGDTAGGRREGIRGALGVRYSW